MPSAKEAIEQVFQELGGVPSLTEWARSHPTKFYAEMYPRLLPLQVEVDNHVKIELSWLHSRPLRPTLGADVGRIIEQIPQPAEPVQLRAARVDDPPTQQDTKKRAASDPSKGRKDNRRRK